MIPTFRPALGAEELHAVATVFERRWLGLGEVSREFEQRLAEFLGTEHVVAVDHGTSALHLALDSLGLLPGDEVIVPSLTFVATVQAIRMTGAVPVFCEVEPGTLNLDVADATQRVTPRTRAMLPVHFAGLPCEMDALLAAARRRGLRIVEDAAHAFGASYRGRKVGTLGDLTCFSFDSIKHITCGEGGAIATSDPALAQAMMLRRRLGMDASSPAVAQDELHWPYHVVTHGFRYHLPDLHAAIGLAQLEKFPRFQARRREIVMRYNAAFAGLDWLEPLQHELTDACPWAYVVKIRDGRRDALREHLKRRGVATLIQFVPNHLQPAFAPFRTELPVTEQLFEQIVTLPLFVEMTEAEQTSVIEAVHAFDAVPASAT